MRASEFEQIRDDYYRAWFRFHPEAALDAGVEGYQHMLRPYTDDEQGALLTLNEKLLATLEELDESPLDPDQQIDFKLMRGAAFLEMEELLELDWRKRDPELYLPLDAIYQLTVRHTGNFAAALKQRLSAIPSYLRGARQYVGQEPERIPPRWLESTITAVEAGATFLFGLPKDMKVQAHNDELKELDRLITDAVEALRGYAQFLEHEIAPRASGDFAVGTRRFNHLLRYRHFLELDDVELHAFGTRLFERTIQDLNAVCRRLTGGEDLAALDQRLEAFRAQGPLLPVYQEQMLAARAFSIDNGLVSFPPREQLTVMETPVFLRHRIPFAAYEPPTPVDGEQHGKYFVTPLEGSEKDEQNALALAHTCVHEAYPGHHIQFTRANQDAAACTLPRLLNKSATLYEGWALYCEQVMVDEGFLGHPESEFILLKDRLWRALRVVIDVGIHARGLSGKDAVASMTNRLGFTQVQALGELTWYSRAPTVPLGYATGWAMINAARELTQAQHAGPGLKTFHDQLLARGSSSLSLALDRSFGNGLSQRVQARIKVNGDG